MLVPFKEKIDGKWVVSAEDTDTLHLFSGSECVARLSNDFLWLGDMEIYPKDQKRFTGLTNDPDPIKTFQVLSEVFDLGFKPQPAELKYTQQTLELTGEK